MSTTPSGLGRPIGASGEETRQRIIEATMRCVAEVGYSRATIREIARVAQMTSGSLYHYFPNKSDLMKVTVAEFADLTVPRLINAAACEGTARHKLMAVLDECDAVMSDYPYVAAFDRALRTERKPRIELLNSDAMSMTATLQTLVVKIIKEAEAEGSLTPEIDVDSGANAIYAIIRGLSEHAALAPTTTYHATVKALKLLIDGQFFYEPAAKPAAKTAPAPKRRTQRASTR